MPKGLVDLTFSVTPAHARLMLDYWEGLGSDGQTAAGGRLGVRGEGMYRGVDLSGFVSKLKTSARRVIVLIAKSSHQGEAISTRDLEAELGASPEEMNGYVGNVGKAWHSITDLPNPFKAERQASSGTYFHRISRELAQRILELLDSEPDVALRT